MPRHGMTDAEWELISDIFPEPASTGRPPRDPRELVDAIFWIVRTGAPWRDIPEEYGPWKTVYNHFDRWNSDGTLDNVRKRLLAWFIATKCLSGPNLAKLPMFCGIGELLGHFFFQRCNTIPISTFSLL